jgi:HEAT repeat protein
MVREQRDRVASAAESEPGGTAIVGNVLENEQVATEAPAGRRDALDDPDPDGGARLAAISEIAASADANSWTALAQAAAGDANPSVRAEALYGLGELGDPTSVQMLENALRDPDPGVRQAAIDALSLVDSELAAQALIRALDHDELAVRAAASDALEDWNEKGSRKGINRKRGLTPFRSGPSSIGAAGRARD